MDNGWKQLCESGYENMESDCWKGVCSACGKGKCLLFTTNRSGHTTWHEWIKDSTGRIIKTVHDGCDEELQDIILKELPAFQEHVRVKRIQSNAFEYDKQQGMVLQIDFAMAYSCDYQNEIQSALWSRNSVQLFTAALKCVKTFLVCSDTKDKGKNTVYAFILKLYEEILKNDDQDTQNIIYSDGPSSEFKNKFMVKFLYLLSKKFHKSFQWKYFATSHGKGVVGGKAKSLVRQKVMSKSENSQSIVQNSMDFARVASSVMTTTTILHVSQSEIDSVIDADKPWKDVADVTDIQRMHIMKISFPFNEVKLWATNTMAEAFTLDIQVDMSTSPILDTNSLLLTKNLLKLNIGDWCAVTYDSKIYAGEILSMTKKKVEVNVMVPSGNFWKWPDKADILLYSMENVIKKLPAPIVVGSRGL